MEKQCQNAQLVRYAPQNVFLNIKPLLVLILYFAICNIKYAILQYIKNNYIYLQYFNFCLNILYLNTYTERKEEKE